MTRVIHTGDTHIGYQQYHSPERRRDFLRAFEQVVADAREDDVDAVVHAGDLFHDRRPDLRDLQGTVAALRSLRDAGVPFLAVVGNHEGKRDGQWLDLFEDLGLATRLDDEPQVVGDTAFYGLDYVPESRRDDLDYDFEPHDADHAALVAHGLFEPFAYADWDTERVLTEATVDFDAMLLGDNHHPDRAQVADAWVTYCGSTERASADEREDRGYNIVRFEDGDAAITRRGLDATRTFAFVDIELAENEGVERVREQVRQHDLEDAVVLVTIDGDGEPVTPAAVEEFATEHGALVARVNDRREREAEEVESSVSFADPDDAVRERVREMGLSEAGRDVDETVRASKVADSNVREEVSRRVRDLIGDDPGAFDAAPDDTEPAPDDGGPDETVDDATDDGPANVAETAGTDAAETDGGPDAQDGQTAAESAGDETTAEDDGDEPSAESDGDGQASMEEYL
ncbi:exonuclease SbcCD subunit D [Halostella sp. JP-L12]|uniref:DNA double-strand break repair protein Mre11 n=1 Tax=Halostella TaxID=1843185 RepID=UPI000EF7B331|nr:MULTISPECIES: DNA double-strand break repair protein Mre11 [Halostella]NHN47575.1 exonuclease SbcCD subunit D [Halostella sp. JP-L12]